MNARRWLIALAILAAVASQALPADRISPPKLPPVTYGGGVWLGVTTLEVIGSAFPTQPEPYVSFELKTVVTKDGAPITDETRTTTHQRVTISTAEAIALRDALDAWLANPTTTTTLIQKSY